jgi:hypothetical protein
MISLFIHNKNDDQSEVMCLKEMLNSGYELKSCTKCFLLWPIIKQGGDNS